MILPCYIFILFLPAQSWPFFVTFNFVTLLLCFYCAFIMIMLASCCFRRHRPCLFMLHLCLLHLFYRMKYFSFASASFHLFCFVHIMISCRFDLVWPDHILSTVLVVVSIWYYHLWTRLCILLLPCFAIYIILYI